MRTLAVLILIAAPVAAQVRLPRYEREVLANGAVVDLLPRRGVPLVSVQVLIRGGAESDPAGMAGLAAITADLLRRGTNARNSERFSEELDAIGATFSARVDEQATILRMEFMSKDAAKALDLLADALLRPAFPEAEVRKTLAERIDSARAMKDSPMTAAAQYYQAFYFGAGHPYGHPAAGDEVSLKNITRAEIAAYHARQYRGANLIVAAVGDFDAGAMKAALEAMLSGVEPGKAYEWKTAPAAASAGPRLLLVDKPDASQTYFYIGSPGMSRTDPDRVSVWLVNTLFGGRFTSMLNDELRVNSGLTYGASSRVDENRLRGRVTIASYTQTSTAGKAIDMALEILKRLREKGITAAQLDSVKTYLKGMYPPDHLETSGQLAGMMGELELYGLGRDEIDGLFARIDAVTVEEANAAAKKHFGNGDLVFVLVGNASAIREAAKKYAPKMVEVPITKAGFAVE